MTEPGAFEQFTIDLSGIIWGLPLLILLTGGGLYLLILSKFLPFRYLGHAIGVLRGKYDNPDDPGEISHFQALSTALSATVGMGNIAGVAVAIAIGGPGAVFWMWISALVGMATKFFTSALSIMYRGKDSLGQDQGGPMYVIVNGLGKKWKPLAIMFSVCGLVGVLPIFNANQLTQAINDILLVPNGININLGHIEVFDLTIYFGNSFVIGVIVLLITAAVILGGLKRISKTASRMVPTMVILYFILVAIILVVNASEVGYYMKLIFTDAFSATNYKGDPFLGGVIGGLILLGIRRAAFSNEAGIGTAPLAHGAAKTSEPIREGLVAMLGPFIDTIIVCTLTALAILVTGVWQTSDQEGVSLTLSAFEQAMPNFGGYLLLICIVIFSMSSLFTYSYYGTKFTSFLFGAKYKYRYNYPYILSILLGAMTSLGAMINIIDSFFGLMAFPTMLSTLILAPKVVKEAKRYFKNLKA